ncbi:hypothetical protein AHF37_06932 [Paragonimus kellicotti]|nr:hypothetical protein AHF37_06932 [Paragonimus kellicotti]
MSRLKNTLVHLGVGLDVRNFKLNYPGLVGGVLKMSNAHFVDVNGYSNLYWDWGQEDDDMEKRLTAKHIPYVHMSPSIARYMAMDHGETTTKNTADAFTITGYSMDTNGLRWTKFPGVQSFTIK